MKSENDASPANDEEIIELTDVVKSGPDAEDVIIDLTDPIETVKAEPHDLAAAVDADQPLELDDVVDEDVQELVDLTDPVEFPEADVVLDAAAEGSRPAFEEDAEEPLDLDLADALDDAQAEETVLDLDEALEEDAAVLDLSQAVADAEAEIEADPEVLDLAEVLDGTESDDGLLELDMDLAAGADEAAAVTLDDAVEPLELTDEVLDDTDQLEDLTPAESFVSEIEDEAEALVDLDTVMEDTGEEEILEPILDLDQPVMAETGEIESIDAVTVDDDGDDLDFQLDEMLADAETSAPDMDDDTEEELDLSEALADAQAESSEEDAEGVFDLDTSVDLTAVSDEAEAFDLISDDSIIELDDPPPTVAATEASAVEENGNAENVIDLADVTGGYPTVTPSLDTNLFAVRPDEGNQDNEAETDLTFGPEDTDGTEEAEADSVLNAEMQKLEETLEEVFQDDDGDDLELGMMPDAMAADADPPAKKMEVPALVTATAVGAPETVPTDIPQETLDAALERVVKTMYADRIDQMVLSVIKEAVMAEIDKVKRSIGEVNPSAD
ncbi:MAG: hypothetical protein QNJ22_05805 [Desulfosarcinaceae bacterium]|nr:hypothetical protein [Desulfosarcinaceae bacterium]